jgi:type I restriction enzyme M protein
MTDNLELEKKLWQAADKLRNNMDAAEYKHVVLGLIFLKYISDAFDELYQQLDSEKAETGADPEDKDEYTAERVFYVPPSARWKWLQGRAKLPTIGKDIDDAMDAIEKDNASLKGVLPKDYARPALDKQRLGELIDLIGSITLSKGGNGKGKDVLGFVFEYFSSGIKCRLFVGKIWEIFFFILHCVLRRIGMRFSMFCNPFYDEMHCVLRSNRR